MLSCLAAAQTQVRLPLLRLHRAHGAAPVVLRARLLPVPHQNPRWKCDLAANCGGECDLATSDRIVTQSGIIPRNGRAVNHPRFLRALLDARGVWRWMCRLSMVQYSSDLNDRHAHLTNRHLNATHKDFQGYWQVAQGWGWQASGGRRVGLRTRGVDCFAGAICCADSGLAWYPSLCRGAFTPLTPRT